ncbi:MAG: HK97 family phage prohead protease [Alloprevotella sp.]
MKKEQTVFRELHTPSGLQLREEEKEGKKCRMIRGYAILFGVASAPLYEDEEEVVREVIAPGAVTRELLDGCDIKMTMFHDRQLILARSNRGSGTLSYWVDEKGVGFEFEAPDTADGEKAVELVRRGDLSGCSFMFSTHYWDEGFVSRSAVRAGDKAEVTYTVKVVTGVYDFTIAADPAYPDTSCEARELFGPLSLARSEEARRAREQVAEMRRSCGMAGLV